MIQVYLGPEPHKLLLVREVELPVLRALGRHPSAKEILGYAIVKDELWEEQHYKCCYCEMKVTKSFNDVEHHRPKGSADRLPGSAETYGYWWVAFTWDNLLFACASCNRSGKNDLFPLEAGSVALRVGQAPPGQEKPLLIHPAKESGIRHIRFAPKTIGGETYWVPEARNDSARGAATIRVCGLGREEYLELYKDHVDRHVRPVAGRIRGAIERSDGQAIEAELGYASFNLLAAEQEHVGLSYDALAHLVPDVDLAPWRYAWPTMT
jgi:uncharacterized protein (TIGR02646 family)